MCSAVEKKRYRTFGVMVAVALIHGGVSPAFFTERLYSKLCGLPVPLPSLEDIGDPSLVEKLKKVHLNFYLHS